MLDDEKVISNAEFESVYNDTNYFVGAIVSEYGFYGNFIDAIKSGTSKMSINHKKYKKDVDFEWIEVIEQSFPALDACIRIPAKEIVEKEEVLPIELSRHINNRSIRHLAQHTDYINSIEGDKITPSKILNVYHDETVLTYENKFLNTLIDRLFGFIFRRYKEICDGDDTEESVKMNFTSDFEVDGSKGKVELNIELSDGTSKSGKMSNTDRVKRLYEVALQYLESDFVKSMNKNYIRPPVMRTNAITKNKNLRQCLELWEFIETYDKIGYKISVEENAAEPDQSYIEQLYSLLSLQYMSFKYNLQNDFEHNTKVVNSQISKSPMSPVFNTELKEIDASDYNVYDTEYRKVVHISQIGSARRKLSKSELQIRQALDTAFKADKIVSANNKKQDKE